MKKGKIILLAILLLASFLRFWRLGEMPALNADEAAIGYNAYSLIQTGTDEHGNPWPIHFQSFNDYKPGLYFYLVLPFVKILGLNVLAVRIPGAFLGVLTVLVVYLLVRELDGYGLRVTGLKDKTRNALTHNGITALTAAFFLAISPWHIHFSRGGWEVNVATFLITTGFWLFIKAFGKDFSVWYLVFSILFFTASLYTYHAARIVVPLLVIGLLVIYRKDFKKNLNKIAMAAIVGVLILIPLGLDFAKGAVFSRVAGVGLFADPGPIARINEQRGEHGDFRSTPAVLLHNKPVNYTLAFLDNWLEHFSGEFLFLSGDDIQRNKVPETGQMYLLDILFLIAGLIAIFKSHKRWKPILLWLIVAPTAAALTFQSPHALRAHNMIIPLVVISAFGLVNLVSWLKRNIKSKRLLVVGYWLLVILVSWQFMRYQHMYWVHLAKEYPYSSQYGVKELVEYVDQVQDRYEKIIVTDRYDQPYILFLFYQKFPPNKFQPEHILTPRDEFGFSTVRTFDIFRFQKIDFEQTRVDFSNSLIAGTDEEIPDEANIVKEIYGQNGHLYFQVVAN
ncbi:MAG: hypothetical protein KAS87_04295 [Candidatus Omnitrophica bacterium]|nr:hypothetical protein [Candidatus Omnitrophota bacterium]